MTSIHQILVGAGHGDAITQMALEIRNGLRAFGPSEIFARFVDPAVADDVSGLHHLPVGRPSDILIYHSSFGDPEVTRTVLRRPEHLVLVYHNITPSRFFVDHDPAFAAGLEWGRHELELLRGRTAMAVADSRFNAEELAALGFADVRVIPAGVRPDRLLAIAPNTQTVVRLRSQVTQPFVLGVSQLLPHKRQEVLIQALHILQWVHHLDLGLVLVGPTRIPAYERGLRELVRRLRVRNVWLAGSQSDSALATLYRSARMFASASMHEGLGIPPLEAMAFGVPAIVRDAGATADTVGSGALVLPFDSGPLIFAEAMRAVHEDDHLRSTLICGGLDRLAELATEAEQCSLIDLLQSSGLVS